MASVGHCPVHTPHPMHFSQFTVALPFILIALKAQASSQAPQAVQFASSTLATYPEESMDGAPYFTIASMPPQQHLQQLQIA
jgi:hypothetical protein